MADYGWHPGDRLRLKKRLFKYSTPDSQESITVEAGTEGKVLRLDIQIQPPFLDVEFSGGGKVVTVTVNSRSVEKIE